MFKHTRLRVHNRLFRKPLVVLQVGKEHKLGQYVSHDGDMLAPPGWDENKSVIVWEDVTLNAFSTLEVKVMCLTQSLFEEQEDV